MMEPTGWLGFTKRGDPDLASIVYEFDSLVIDRETIICNQPDSRPKIVFQIDEIDVNGIIFCNKHKKIDLRRS